jgi:hypothetical protein
VPSITRQCEVMSYTRGAIGPRMDSVTIIGSYFRSVNTIPYINRRAGDD